MEAKDLVILVADADMEQAVHGLLTRPKALGISEGVTYDIVKHPRRDPGVFGEAPDFLRRLQRQYRHALVLFDRRGAGRDRWSAKQMEQDLQHRLDKAGWRDRSAVVVLDPELEVWVFSNSPQVVEVIAAGDKGIYERVVNDHPKSASGKPERPKEVMVTIVKAKGIPWSSALHRELAEKVSFSRCSDPAFRRFQGILKKWFPRTQAGSD